MNNGRWILMYITVGAIAFWVPDIAFHAVRAHSYTRKDVVTLTIILPISVLTFYAALFRLRSKQGNNLSIAGFMLLGVWLLGSSAMVIGYGLLSGISFSELWPHGLAALVLGLIPIYLFIMSGYDGSLGALLITTILMLFMQFMFESNHRMIPSQVRQVLRSKLKRENV